MLANVGNYVGGLALAALLSLAMLIAPAAEAAPVGALRAVEQAAGSPVVTVQARRGAPARQRASRRGRNNAALAAGLIGAAIVGGAIIANSRPARPAPRYYYEDEYPVDAYGRPVYRQQPYYAPAPVYQPQPYYAPEPVYRQPRAYRPQPQNYQAPPVYRPQPQVHQQRRDNQPNYYRPYSGTAGAPGFDPRAGVYLGPAPDGGQR